MKQLILVTFFLFIYTAESISQVGIGTVNPDSSAVLHLSSTDKGLLISRVNLSSITYQLGTHPNAMGLMVYNNPGNELTQGFYFWDGSEWRIFDNSTAVAPSIVNMVCDAGNLSPNSYASGVPYNGTLTIPYQGGNGGTYISGASKTVNGLQFVLRAGKLNSGSGEFVFTVSGTPTVSSPTTTTITIDSLSIPFISTSQTCSATVGNLSNALVKNSATYGPLVSTSDPVAGYHKVVTSPDNKFSIRVVISDGFAFSNADLQIRSNVGTPTIMWNAGTYYVNGTIHQGNNGMTFPSAGVWYGNDGANGTTMFSGITNSWGDADVYFNSPEWRRYTWTSTDPNDKTMYIMEFMLGAPNSSLLANSTNCPSGVCTSTKAYIKIEEVRAE